MHVAESITPAPMTRVTIGEYYRRWSPKLTLFGGIPSTIMLPGTPEADFEAYLDAFFRAVAPGTRMVVGIADEVPPEAVFARLQRLGERIEREGRLPLQAGAFRPMAAAPAPARTAAPAAAGRDDATFAEVKQDVFGGKHVAIKAHVQALLDRGVPAADILEHGLIAAITVVGNRMASGEAFIPEVLLAARAMSVAMGMLEPHLAAGGERLRGRILIGTVAGDMHDIGKNLVGALLEGGGFEVVDLGVDVPPARFVAAVEERKPELLGLSALLTTTMPGMKTTLEAIQGVGLRERVKVMIGGAPVTESFARSIGADGYADNAASAVDLARRLIGVTA
jgi:5-methyltetrahydrofolate--homocysteine methyltransferase